MIHSDYDLSDNAYKRAILNQFPAILNQQSNSNNQKILNIISDLKNEQKNNLLNISEQSILNNMKGKTLTDYASDFGINRIDNDDEFLRFQIRLEMLKGKISATTAGTKRFIASALGIKTTDFQVNQTGIDEVEITNIPFNFEGNRVAIKRQIISNAIQSILPPSVILDDIQYVQKSAGTWLFGMASSISIEKNERMLI